MNEREGVRACVGARVPLSMSNGNCTECACWYAALLFLRAVSLFPPLGWLAWYSTTPLWVALTASVSGTHSTLPSLFSHTVLVQQTPSTPPPQEKKYKMDGRIVEVQCSGIDWRGTVPWLYLNVLQYDDIANLNWYQVVRLESVYRGNVLRNFKSISDSQSDHPTNVSNLVFLLLPTHCCMLLMPIWL